MKLNFTINAHVISGDMSPMEISEVHVCNIQNSFTH